MNYLEAKCMDWLLLKAYFIEEDINESRLFRIREFSSSIPSY